MNRQPVSGSDIVSVGYDSATSTLEIEFRHDGVYQCTNVPESVYTALMESSSKTLYYNNNIKPHFTVTKVS